MITAKIFRNSNNHIYGFHVDDHANDHIVCASVSILTINTINSIEAFTDEHIICDYEEEGGFLKLELPEIKNNKVNKEVQLLLNAMLLGLSGIESENKNEIRIIDSM